MKNTKRNFIIIIVIALGVMIFSFRNDYANILQMFSNINYLWLVVSIFLILLFHFLDALYYYIYFKRIESDFSLYKAVQFQQTGTFFSAITPFASGGQVAQIIVAQKQKIDSKHSASVLMMSFISWQSVLVIFGAILLIINFRRMNLEYSAIFNLVFLGFAINVGVISFLFLGSFSNVFHHFIFEKVIPFLGKIKIIKNIEVKKSITKNWLDSFRGNFQHLIGNKDLLFSRLTIDIVRIFLFYSISFFAAKSLNVDLQPNMFMYMLVLTAFVYMIAAFIPIPGAAGGSEGSFVLLLGPILGLATTSVMLLWRFISYYIPMLVSFIVFVLIKEIKE